MLFAHSLEQATQGAYDSVYDDNLAPEGLTAYLGVLRRPNTCILRSDISSLRYQIANVSAMTTLTSIYSLMGDILELNG